ncbi:hypothetical protein CLOM_g6913 [Closterium sp. NIES-68]|nr:hypothetical protein CLOM_g6913 [Closterium sp. NIES-68]GJP69953.1 hypothetical protein CLOP_g947 [Closterium sp. NIES-67]
MVVRYVRGVSAHLDRRLLDLQNLEGTKLFLDPTYLADDILHYDVDWFDVVAIFRNEKPRRPFKDFTGTVAGQAQFVDLDEETDPGNARPASGST